jgi:DNA (cytosine-5)-methyltransferase 1
MRALRQSQHSPSSSEDYDPPVFRVGNAVVRESHTRAMVSAATEVKLCPRLDSPDDGLTVVGLFAGIGGIELGLHRAGHSTVSLCEIDDAACAVLGARFAGLPLSRDVRRLKSLPRCDLVVAGFPCQDLSQAGRTAGIRGENSGLVQSVFRLFAAAKHAPTWLLLENVPFMLQLGRGKAMRYVTTTLEELGLSWAYRVVDTRAFGLPQRRRRVILLASRTEDPREVLLVEDEEEQDLSDATGRACGFYWTEGIRGLGWAVDAVPTLKGGSTIGIPSPPAIRMPDGSIVLPDIRDAERLQGFDAGWTKPAESVSRRKGIRWKLVCNAVSVPVAEWVGERLRYPQRYSEAGDQTLSANEPWPQAAWGRRGRAYRVPLSAWPTRKPYVSLADFLKYPSTPLSARATKGFWKRTKRSSLRFPAGFLSDVERHLERVTDEAA